MSPWYPPCVGSLVCRLYLRFLGKALIGIAEFLTRIREVPKIRVDVWRSDVRDIKKNNTGY